MTSTRQARVGLAVEKYEMNTKINILDGKYDRRGFSPRTKELHNQYGRRIQRANSK